MNSQKQGENKTSVTQDKTFPQDELTPVAPGSFLTKTKIVGAIAIAYGISLISQNIVFIVSGAPDYRDPLAVVLKYHAENVGAMSVATGFEVLNLLLLLLFVTSLHGLVQRRGGMGTTWSQLAMVSGAPLSTLFALMIATHIGVVLAANGLTEPTPVLALIWQLHAAIFALALPALGMTFIASVLAIDATGLGRLWHRMLGIAGGTLLILVGLGNLAIAGGSPLVYGGVLGLFLWIIWLISIGLRMIRR